MNNVKSVIGIVGKLKSGKTTTANFLIERFEKNHRVIKIAFADLLKQMILNSGLCTKEELWGEKTDFSRLMLQKIGTEIIRKQISENFWVNKMTEKIVEINNADIVIIDDTRFMNEYSLIRFFNGSVIKIIRPSLEQDKEENKHISETELEKISSDYQIFNDEDLDYLKEIVFSIPEKTLLGS